MVEPAEPAWDGPVPDDAGFREWMLVRASALRRKAFLLCGDWSAADDLVQDVLVAMYPRWSRIVRGGHVDAYANRVLVGKHVDARRRPWRRERARGWGPRLGRLHQRARHRRSGRTATGLSWRRWPHSRRANAPSWS